MTAGFSSQAGLASFRVTATSVSDHQRTAQRALAAYDANEAAYHALPESEREGRNYEWYEDALLDAAHALADALRALIRPQYFERED